MNFFLQLKKHNNVQIVLFSYRNDSIVLLSYQNFKNTYHVSRITVLNCHVLLRHNSLHVITNQTRLTWNPYQLVPMYRYRTHCNRTNISSQLTFNQNETKARTLSNFLNERSHESLNRCSHLVNYCDAIDRH